MMQVQSTLGLHEQQVVLVAPGVERTTAGATYGRIYSVRCELQLPLTVNVFPSDGVKTAVGLAQTM